MFSIHFYWSELTIAKWYRLVSNLWQCKVWLGFFGVDFLKVEKWTHCHIDVTCIFFYLFLNREDTVHKQSEITCLMKYSIYVVSVNFTGIFSFKDNFFSFYLRMFNKQIAKKWTNWFSICLSVWNAICQHPSNHSNYSTITLVIFFLRKY